MDYNGTVYPNEVTNALVQRVFCIEDVTAGTAKQPFIVRYRGHLAQEDSAAAYDQLAGALKPYNLTPLFRWDGDRQAILLVPSIPEPKRSNPKVNLWMAVATIVSVLYTGGIYGLTAPLPADWTKAALALILGGLPFALSMMAILAAHEFGHYLAGRYHKVQVSLPYFIPLPAPLSPFGTLGAFINMKEMPKNRRQLLDIGIAGPLCGLIVAIPVLILGLYLSHIEPIPTVLPAGTSLSMEGNSILYLLAKWLVFGRVLPAPVSYGNLSPLLYQLRYFFTGHPTPLGSLDVVLSPVAWAGWAGILITGLNLIPAGQLDGGHLLYVLFGHKTARRILPVIVIAIAVLGFVWMGWWLWVALILFFGRYYAEPLDQITPLDGRRKALAVIGLIAFVLTFTPVPLSLFT